jgi:hypothetical protein
MKIGILASAVGLAVSAVALAEASKTSDFIPVSRTSLIDPEIQVFQKTGFPREDNNGLVGEARLSPLNGGREFRAPVQQSSANTFDPRGTPNVVTLRTDYEAITGPMGEQSDFTFTGNGRVFAPSFMSGTLPPNVGFNARAGQTATFVRIIDPVNNPTTPAPPAGSNGVSNTTKMVRHRSPATPPNPPAFFTGHNTRTLVDLTQAPGSYTTFPIAPTADNDATVSMEVYNTTTGEQHSFEPVAIFTLFVTGRILWGGTCIEVDPGECTDFGLPNGAITEYLSLGPDPASFTTGIFVPAAICEDVQGNAIPGCVPPAGTNVGDPTTIVVGSWHRMIGRTTSDGRFETDIDRLDGNPAYTIYSNILLTSGFLDRIGSNTSFESPEAVTFFDNIEFQGEPFVLPTAPDLECPFIDDLEWLNTGPVLGQTDAWFVALSSAANIVVDGARGQVMQQINNVSSDNEYREEMRRNLPNGFATGGDPWELCVEVRTTGGTVRGFAPDSELTNFVDGGVTTRVYLGREDPNDPQNPFFENSIYVQINVEYNPIDDPFGANPQDNIPVIGVDIADTGANWATGSYRELCINVDVDNGMTVSSGGTLIYTGTAFANGANVYRFESENQGFGSGSSLRLNDVDFACSALPLVTLPALTVPYLDDMEWGIPGLPPNRHIDDELASPNTSTRYTTANGVVMAEENLLRGTSIVVAMQNVFRDTTQVAPPDVNSTEPFIFTQFTTDTPSIQVTPGGSDAWVVEMDWAMNDFFTSRGFSTAQLADVGGLLEIGGYLWYSAQDDKFYLFAAADGAAPEDDLINIDTGVTRASLGITPNAAFTVKAEYLPATDKIEWSVNGTVLGATNPIVGTDDQMMPRVHRSLDAIFVWGGDDDTAPAVAPLSTLFLDNLRVTSGATPCPGDTNGDRVVNFTDLNAVLATFGQTGPGLPGDVDGSGSVNFTDLNIILSNFGTTCP